MSNSLSKLLIFLFFTLLVTNAFSAREINTIKIGNTTYTFFDTDSFQKFKNDYANTKCEEESTTPINCECHRLKLNGMLNSQISKRKTRKLNYRIRRIKHFMQKANAISKRSIRGKQCRDFRSYKAQDCKSKNKKNSCACLSLWYQKQIDYLERKVDQDVENILKERVKSIDPSKVILTNLKFLEQCQITPPNSISEVPCKDPVPLKETTQATTQATTQEIKECVPSKLALPKIFQNTKEITKQDIATLDLIKRSNQNLNSKNLANFLCQSSPVLQNGSIQTNYIARRYSDIIELSKRLPPNEQSIVQSLAKHPCFKTNAQSLEYCKHFKLSCQDLRSSSTETLKKKIINFAKKSCLQALCEGYVTNDDFNVTSEVNKLFTEILNGTNYTDINEFCKQRLSQYPGNGYPLQRSTCDGFNGPSRGIVKGQKCTPGVDQQYSTFYTYENGKVKPTPKKPKDCKAIAPTCFKEFDEDFFYCQLTPHTQLTKKCKDSAKTHKKLEWAVQFEDTSKDFNPFVDYIQRLTDLEIHKLSFLNKDKLTEYYPLNGQGYGVNACIDGTLSEHIAPIYSELVTTIATGPIKLVDYSVRGFRATSEYMEDVNDDLNDHYRPTQFDFSVAITKFHQCMTKSCERQDQKSCFDEIKEFDRKNFLFQRYNSTKCKITRGAQRVSKVAEATGKTSKVLARSGLLARFGSIADTIRPEKLSDILEETPCTDNELNEVFNFISQSPKAYYELAKIEKLKGLTTVCENYKAKNAHTDPKNIMTTKEVLDLYCKDRSGD